MRRWSIFLFAVLLMPQYALAGGSFVVAEKLVPLLKKTPTLYKYVSSSFELEPSGIAGRIGQSVNPNLGGTRVGPYVVLANRKGTSGTPSLRVTFVTRKTFLGTDGEPASLETATRVKEVITSIEVSPLTEQPADKTDAQGTGDEPSIYDRVHKKAELPTGGEFVAHPKKPEVRYYFTNRLLMWRDKSNADKHSGLYTSSDSGKTWKLRCKFFEFQKLFIHPDTGMLYCIIDYTWLKENKQGFLWPHSANKALMSEDGKHWKDITGGHGYIADISGLMADPDNAGRVCLLVNALRRCVLQSEDDEYSKWIWHKGSKWESRKEKQ